MKSQDRALLRRRRGGGDRGPGRGHDLRGAARVPRRRASTSRSSSCSACPRGRRSLALGGDRAPGQGAAPPLPHRRRRQVRRGEGLLQEPVRGAAHGGIANEAAVELVWVDAERIEREGLAGTRGRARRHPGAGRLRRPRHRGQDPGHPLRARAARAVLRHLPRHAVRGHRVRAARVRPRGRQLHRVRRRRRAQRDRSRCPSSVGHPGQGRHHAARRSTRAARARARSPRGSTGRGVIEERHRHRYEVNNDYLRAGSRRTGSASPASGPRSSSSRSSSCPTTRGSWPASSIPSSGRKPWEPHPLFAALHRGAALEHQSAAARALTAPRARAAPSRTRPLAGLTVGGGAPAAPLIGGPVRDRERAPRR